MTTKLGRTIAYTKAELGLNSSVEQVLSGWMTDVQSLCADGNVLMA